MTCIFAKIDVYYKLFNKLKCKDEDNNRFVDLQRTGSLAGSPAEQTDDLPPPSSVGEPILVTDDGPGPLADVKLHLSDVLSSFSGQTLRVISQPSCAVKSTASPVRLMPVAFKQAASAFLYQMEETRVEPRAKASSLSRDGAFFVA